jgi:hypothetical protein
MTTSRPDDQRITASSLAEDAAMYTSTLGLPRWPIVQVFGRNPLVRTSDRVEALVLVLAVVESLLAVPIGAPIGTAVHDSIRHLYAEQAQSRHPVTATVTATMPPSKTRRTNRSPCPSDGLSPEPNTPARSRHIRQPKSRILLRSGSTTTVRRFTDLHRQHAALRRR